MPGWCSTRRAASMSTLVDSPVKGSRIFFICAAATYRSGTTWTQQAYLKASTARTLEYFGSSVAISGDTVIMHDGWSIGPRPA